MHYHPSMLLPLIFALFQVALTATVVPIDSSTINVKNSGKEYSYTIHENHGVAIEPLVPQVPVFNLSPPIGGLVKNPNEVRSSIDQLFTRNDDNKIEGGASLEKERKPVAPQMMASGTYPISLIPTYGATYLPAQYPLMPYPYGINYPYNLIATY